MGTLRVVLKNSGELLAEAGEKQVQRLEGNYYIHPDCITTGNLHTSDRTYKCPAKGISYWVDLKTPRGYLNDISWVYPTPLPEYAHIAGWYGFYPTHSKYEILT